MRGVLAALAIATLGRTAAEARAEDKPPITIGFSIEQTGGLAAVGKTGLLAFQIWAEDINKKGGLLGRQVKLVFYDDQSNPANVPGIYTKLIEIDKVDLLVSSYATNLVAPAMPIIMQKNRLFFGLFALGINVEFHYPKYFSMLVFGPDPKPTFSKGWFDIAMAQNPRSRRPSRWSPPTPSSAATRIDGARQNAKAAGLQTVYDRAYPPTTVDYTPIMRAVQAANPDIVYVASYPPDTVGILHAINELNYAPTFFGGTVVGTAAAAFRTQLGPLLNGVVVGENWEPAKSNGFSRHLGFPQGIPAEGQGAGGRSARLLPTAFRLRRDAGAGRRDHRHRRPRRGGQARRLHPRPPFQDGRRRHQFWPRRRMDQTGRTCSCSITGLKNNDIEQFRDDSHVTILYPAQFKTGDLISPFTKAKE